MREVGRVDFTNQVALVTGASRGIGRAIALDLAKRGASVIVNFAKDEEGAGKTAACIKELGGKAYPIQADISETKATENLIAEAVESCGTVDILINNAGITRDQIIAFMPEEDWDLVMRTNLLGAMNCSREAVAIMKQKKYGRIINISSVVGITGNAGQTNYAASKAGLIGYTKELAHEVGKYGITVNAVAAGYIPTPLTEALSESTQKYIQESIPMGRCGTPEEVSYAVAFLASKGAGYLTGHVLNVDGGMAMD
jgi:3-oxoacyl-[acyl-carrier protein] reductase